MVSEKILVGSALGIHLRPAGAMCDTGPDEEEALKAVSESFRKALQD